MRKSYRSPELVVYGSVGSLTASFIKCTPMPDSAGWGHSHAEQAGVIVDPDEHMTNCLPVGQLTP